MRFDTIVQSKYRQASQFEFSAIGRIAAVAIERAIFALRLEAELDAKSAAGPIQDAGVEPRRAENICPL